MLAVSLGVYFLFMAFIWGMFLVAKVHFFKFKEYSKYIYPATKVVMITLLLLTFLGGLFIYKISTDSKHITTIEAESKIEVY